MPLQFSQLNFARSPVTVSFFCSQGVREWRSLPPFCHFSNSFQAAGIYFNKVHFNRAWSHNTWGCDLRRAHKLRRVSSGRCMHRRPPRADTLCADQPVPRTEQMPDCACPVGCLFWYAICSHCQMLQRKIHDPCGGQVILNWSECPSRPSWHEAVCLLAHVRKGSWGALDPGCLHDAWITLRDSYQHRSSRLLCDQTRFNLHCPSWRMNTPQSYLDFTREVASLNIPVAIFPLKLDGKCVFKRYTVLS